MRLPFLLPDKACGGNNYSCGWYDACATEHSFVILRVGSVGDCLFFPNGSHKKRVCWSSSRSRELSSLVMALPAGFILCANNPCIYERGTSRYTVV